ATGTAGNGAAGTERLGESIGHAELHAFAEAVLRLRLKAVVVQRRETVISISDGSHSGVAGAQEIRVDFRVAQNVRGVGIGAQRDWVQFHSSLSVPVEAAHVGNIDDGVEADVALDGEIELVDAFDLLIAVDGV